MIDVTNLERQHDGVKKLFKDIKDNINNIEVKESLDKIVLDINTLAGKLIVHMNSEDKFLYPKLLNSEDTKIKSMAKEYIDEMGDLHNKFREYKGTFNTKNKIIENKDTFIKETTKIITLLENRINKEDKKLYPQIKEM
ncbi:hemerythrin domain-containing protein [Clostridium sp.]|uniref:hemerythrin domain-containing protein n=1 Tax=Clostridium sp. TaxID=1506 RepID=UPI00262EFE38|nr:hemerythrin domain-containing protein [Clostridium sp.]